MNRVDITPEVELYTLINGVKTDGMLTTKVVGGDIAVLIETKYNKNISDKAEL